MSGENSVNFLVKTLDTMQVPGFALVVSAAALILILLAGRRQGRTAFFYPTLLLAATVLNPFLFPYLFEKDPSLSSLFYMVVSILPFELICAFAVIVVSGRVRNRAGAFLCFIILTAGVLAAGSGLVNPIGGGRDSLAYDTGVLANVPESRQIADYLSEKMTSDSLSAWTDVEGLDYDIRGYDASITFSTKQTKSTECFITTKGSRTAAELGRDRRLLGSTTHYLIYAAE